MTQTPGDALSCQQPADNSTAADPEATTPIPEQIVREALRRFVDVVRDSQQAADALRPLLISVKPDAEAILAALRPPRGEA